jgi:SPP1 gp7 family putative phage head morphogenesis protein
LTRRALGKPPAGLVIDWNRIDRAGVETILGMTQADSPLYKLLLSISDEGAQAAEDALVQGMLLGKNPREVALDVRGALGTQLSRALTIARTETLRAYREATRATYRQMGVQQWEWRSARNERTCAACWAMDGKRFSVDEPMPAHVNCRCVMLPVTKTWEELGFTGIEELEQPAPALERFAALRPDQQLMVLGPAKFGAYQAGVLKLTDLVGWKVDPLWGKSVFEKKRGWGWMDGSGWNGLPMFGVTSFG